MAIPEMEFRLTEEQSKLASANYNLVFWYMSKKNMPEWTDWDDYHSVLNKFYLRSIATYDPSKSKLSGYVVQMLRWGRVHYLETSINQRERFGVSIYQSDEVTIEKEVSEDKSANLVTLERKQFIERLMDLIGPVNARIVKLHNMDGIRFADIARDIGVSRQRVQQLHVKSMRKIQRHIKEHQMTRESIGV